MEELKKTIEYLYENPEELKSPRYQQEVEKVIDLLDQGKVRVASPPEEEGGEWILHTWVKKAILLYFKIRPLEKYQGGDLEFYDKIPVKKDFSSLGIRVVPPAVARYGSYIEKGVILMPSYVNIGAYVGEGTLVDTWATVGSCAQIGKYVHLSGGVGIGGVLEPPQAKPVIIEDHVFIGSRCVVVEGVHVKKRAVLGSGVILTASTKIIDVTGEEEKVYTGVVPEDSVVIPGTRKRKFPAGEYYLPCALIIGKRKASTDEKTSLNEVLREFPEVGA